MENNDDGGEDEERYLQGPEHRDPELRRPDYDNDDHDAVEEDLAPYPLQGLEDEIPQRGLSCPLRTRSLLHWYPPFSFLHGFRRHQKVGCCLY